MEYLLFHPDVDGVDDDAPTGERRARLLCHLRLSYPGVPRDDHLVLRQRRQHLLDDAGHQMTVAVGLSYKRAQGIWGKLLLGK